MGHPAVKDAGVLGEHKQINVRLACTLLAICTPVQAESAFSLLKRGIIGTSHRSSAKHLQAYLDETSLRFDNRKNPYLFRDTMKRMLNSDNLEFKELVAA